MANERVLTVVEDLERTLVNFIASTHHHANTAPPPT